jgi:hypothetical protein
MKAGRVHAVIAAGLENPALLARWRREPELLRDCGVEPRELDLDALWKFAGLSAKVRHNGLRADLPLSFRLMNVAGLEIEVFAAYATSRADEGRRYAETTVERAQDLLAFLEHWLDFERREHALLWDLLRYELALARLGRMPAPTRASGEAAADVARAGTSMARAASVPRVCGHVVLHEMRSDPRQVGAMLHEKSPRLGEAALGSFHFCYWRRDAAAEIHILRLDELGFYLLSLADGARTVAEMSLALGGGRRHARWLTKALGELAAVGVLAFEPSGEQAR